MKRSRILTPNTDMVSNGYNFTATTNWVPQGALTLSIVSAEMVLTVPATGAFLGAQINLANLIVGAMYRVICVGRRGTCASNIGINISSGFTNGPNAGFNASTTNFEQIYELQCNLATGAVIIFDSSASSGGGTQILNRLSIKRMQATSRRIFLPN